MRIDRPFITRSFLRAALEADFASYLANGKDDALIERLQSWAGDGESSSEASLIQTFLVELWGYRHPYRGQDGHEIVPKAAVAGGGVGGGTGEIDVALGRFGTNGVADTTQVAVELKSRRIGLDTPQKGRKDKRTPVQQALGYLDALRRPMIGTESVQPTWAIVTDMNVFRLYWWNRAPAEYIEFRIERGDLLEGEGLLGGSEEARFERFLFWWLFRPEQLLTRGGPSALERMIGRSFVKQRDIEKTFYAEYRAYRERLYETIRAANPDFPGTQARLVRLTQKLLDRAIFVFYCEDMGTRLGFPPQLLRDFLRTKAADPYYDPNGTDIWYQLRRMFAAMNTGGDRSRRARPDRGHPSYQPLRGRHQPGLGRDHAARALAPYRAGRPSAQQL